MVPTILLSPQQQPLGECHIANRMDLDPVATEGEIKKKRKSDVNDDLSKKSRKRESISGKHCHQCHQVKDTFMECTALTTRGKKTGRCSKVFCQECLKRRYDEDLPAIISAGRPRDLTKLLGHVQTESYVWRCPICSRNCNCAPHRKQYGLPPTGFISSLAKERGLTVAQLLQDPGAIQAAKPAKIATSKKTTSPSPDPRPAEGEGTTDQNGKKKKLVEKVIDEVKVKVKVKVAEKVKGKVVKEKAVKPAATKASKPIIPAFITPTPIKPFIKQPKHVLDPEFEFIGISYPLKVIEKRLHVREFVLRFEKKLAKLPPKYFRTINDPNSEWTDLTYRNLITSLLLIIQADGDHLIHGDRVYEAIIEIQKTTADNPRIWTILKSLLEETYPENLPDNFDDEGTKLEAIMLAINLTLQATLIRQQIDEDMEKERNGNKAAVAEIRRLKTDWEQTKGELQKERLLLKASERVGWDDRYAKAFSANKKLIALVEERQWFTSRKACLRTTPLGIDAKGNTYWMFTQRDKRDEDWGQWVVVEKNGDLPHPSGTLKDEPNDTLENEFEKENKEITKSRIWYAVSGAQNVRHLAEWIKYQTDLVLFRQATAVNMRIDDSSSFMAAATPPYTPKKHRSKSPVGTPSRQLMIEVRLPQRSSEKVDPADLATKESTEALSVQLQKIAGFMELNEEPQKLI